jgi:hypothetical protein
VDIYFISTPYLYCQISLAESEKYFCILIPWELIGLAVHPPLGFYSKANSAPTTIIDYYYQEKVAKHSAWNETNLPGVV